MVLVRSFRVALRVWFRVAWPAALMYLNSALCLLRNSQEASPGSDVCCGGEAMLPWGSVSCAFQKGSDLPPLSFSPLGRLGDGIEDSLSTVSLFSFMLPVLRPPPMLPLGPFYYSLCARPGYTFEMLKSLFHYN